MFIVHHPIWCAGLLFPPPLLFQDIFSSNTTSDLLYIMGIQLSWFLITCFGLIMAHELQRCTRRNPSQAINFALLQFCNFTAIQSFAAIQFERNLLRRLISWVPCLPRNPTLDLLGWGRSWGLWKILVNRSKGQWTSHSEQIFKPRSYASSKLRFTQRV